MGRLQTLPSRVQAMPSRLAPAPERYGQGRGGRPWRRTVERIKARDKGLCQPHLREGLIHIGHECDHVVPLSQGGSDTDTNLEWVCRDYHSAKTAREARGG